MLHEVERVMVLNSDESTINYASQNLSNETSTVYQKHIVFAIYNTVRSLQKSFLSSLSRETTCPEWPPNSVVLITMTS